MRCLYQKEERIFRLLSVPGLSLHLVKAEESDRVLLPVKSVRFFASKRRQFILAILFICSSLHKNKELDGVKKNRKSGEFLNALDLLLQTNKWRISFLIKRGAWRGCIWWYLKWKLYLLVNQSRSWSEEGLALYRCHRYIFRLVELGADRKQVERIRRVTATGLSLVRILFRNYIFEFY